MLVGSRTPGLIVWVWPLTRTVRNTPTVKRTFVYICFSVSNGFAIHLCLFTPKPQPHVDWLWRLNDAIEESLQRKPLQECSGSFSLGIIGVASQRLSTGSGRRPFNA